MRASGISDLAQLPKLNVVGSIPIARSKSLLRVGLSEAAARCLVVAACDSSRGETFRESLHAEAIRCRSCSRRVRALRRPASRAAGELAANRAHQANVVS